MKMAIKEMIGPRCIIREDGQKVYDAIYPLLQRGETVTLDFMPCVPCSYQIPFKNVHKRITLLKDLSISN